jgi:hypothetical protein
MEDAFRFKVSKFVYLAVLAFAIFIHGNANASRLLLHETFEGGSWGALGHGPTGGDADGTSTSTEQAYSGSWSAKVNYGNGNNLNHIWYSGLQDQIDQELYVSFWFFHSPTFQMDRNFKFMRLTNSFDSFNTNNEFIGHGFFVDGVNAVFADPPPNNNLHWQPASECGNPDNSDTGSVNPLTRGQWHHWEFYGKLNTNGNDDGIIRVWINGTLVIDKTNWTWVAPGCDPQSSKYKWDTVYLPSNLADRCQTTCLYYVDEVQIWDGMPDAGSVLSPPTNLRVE